MDFHILMSGPSEMVCIWFMVNDLNYEGFGFILATE